MQRINKNDPIYKAAIKAIRKKDYPSALKILRKFRKIPFRTRKRFLPWQKAYISRYLKDAVRWRYTTFRPAPKKEIERARKKGLHTTTAGIFDPAPSWESATRELKSGALARYSSDGSRIQYDIFLTESQKRALARTDSEKETESLINQILREHPTVWKAYRRHAPKRQAWLGLIAQQGPIGPLLDTARMHAYKNKHSDKETMQDYIIGIRVVIIK